MKKFIVFLCGLLCLTGCYAEYGLEIDGSTFSEDINVYIFEGDREADLHDGVESGDRISGFIDYDVFTYFEDYSSVYDKKVTYKDEYTLVNLKKSYSAEEFKNTNSIRLCFENQQFDVTDEYYDIHMSGYFYCLYNNDTLTVKIKSNNKVIDHNADKVEGNDYYWIIDRSNFTNVDIMLKTEKNASNETIVKIVIASLIILGLVGILVVRYFVKKKNGRNDF